MFGKGLLIVCTLAMVAGCKGTMNSNSDGSGFGSHSHNGYMNVAPGSQADLEVNVGDRVMFAFDSSSLDSEAQMTLDRQAQWMKQYSDVNVMVEGHCDERGTRDYNMALGERRAHAVKRYLLAAGVDESRIMTMSYGKERPAVMGSGEEAWSQNRRGVTVVR